LAPPENYEYGLSIFKPLQDLKIKQKKKVSDIIDKGLDDKKMKATNRDEFVDHLVSYWGL